MKMRLLCLLLVLSANSCNLSGSDKDIKLAKDLTAQLKALFLDLSDDFTRDDFTIGSSSRCWFVRPPPLVGQARTRAAEVKVYKPFGFLSHY